MAYKIITKKIKEKDRVYEYGDEIYETENEAIENAKKLDRNAIEGQINLRHKVLKIKGKYVVRRFSPSLY